MPTSTAASRKRAAVGVREPDRTRSSSRRVREILTVGARVEDGVIETSTLLQRDSAGDLRLNEAASLEFDAFARRGVDVHELVGLR